MDSRLTLDEFVDLMMDALDAYHKKESALKPEVYKALEVEWLEWFEFFLEKYDG